MLRRKHPYQLCKRRHTHTHTHIYIFEYHEQRLIVGYGEVSQLLWHSLNHYIYKEVKFSLVFHSAAAHYIPCIDTACTFCRQYVHLCTCMGARGIICIHIHILGSKAVWGLGTKWLSSLQPSEEASWWSWMPNWCGSASTLSLWFSSHSPEFCAEGMHSLITLDKCMNLQSIQSRSFFSFLVGNVILNKNVTKKANTCCVFLLYDQPTQKKSSDT